MLGHYIFYFLSFYNARSDRFMLAHTERETLTLSYVGNSFKISVSQL